MAVCSRCRALTWAINFLEKCLVSDKVDVSILFGHVGNVLLGLIDPVDELNLVVYRAE